MNLKIAIIIISSIVAFGQMQAQGNSPWYSFWNQDSTLIGFKDKNGKIQIEAKFSDLAIYYIKFDDIIAVTDFSNDKYKSYYLTKTGKKVAQDSMFYFDNAFDCESEGFIRFHDPKNDKVGVLNRNGDVVIPAIYSALSRVMNGMLYALKDATKNYEKGGEHYFWNGGKEMLIDSNNNILIENFVYNENLNLYSLKISDKADSDSLRKNYLTKNGKYFSFIDNELEFKYFLETNLLNNLTKDNLLKISLDSIVFDFMENYSQPVQKNSFFDNNYKLVVSKLKELKDSNCEYHIFYEHSEILDENLEISEKINNNCGEIKNWMYPVKSIVINHYINKDLVQDHFTFIRIHNVYKLANIIISY